jgi:hypothetical protein
MQKEHSINHHYLPIFFQKGFCNEDKMIHVYDKENCVYLPASPPKRHFFKKNLNNYRYNNKIISSTEKTIYSPMDSKGAKVFNKIINNKTLTDITTPFDRIDLLMFMTHLFWRSPSSDNIFKEIIDKEGACNKYFGLHNPETGTKISDDDFPEFKEKILSDYEFMKIFKILIPESDANKEEILNLVMNWKLFILESNSSFSYLTGDSPILFQNEKIRLGKIFNKVIFPISKNQVLILNDKIPKFLDDHIVRAINMSIIHTSKRFIASDSLTNLEYFINMYNEFIKLGKESTALDSAFGLIDYISHFSDFEHYKYNIEKQINRK